MKIIPTMQPYRPGAPSPVDIAVGLPVAREIIEQAVEVDVNEESFEVIRNSLPAFVARWQQEVQTFFANLVRSSCDVPADVDPLSLAVGTYFVCDCGHISSSYQNASWHRCKQRLLQLDKSKGDAFMASVASTLPVCSHFWQAKGFAVVPRIQFLVTLLGLDPLRVTSQEMDESSPRLACKKCDGSGRPRHRVTILTWRHLISNHVRHYLSSEMFRF